MKIFNAITVMLLVGTVSFIGYSLIKDSGKKYYTITTAEESTIEEKLHLAGFVFPSKEIEVKPQISGVVDAVYVKVGDVVKKGDPVASISLVPNSSEVEQLKNNVNVARINITTAKETYERQKQLLEKKAISRIDFEAAKKEYLTMQENYSTAVKQLNFRQKGKNQSNNIVRSSTSGVIIDIPIREGSSVIERSNYNAGSTVATIAGADHYIFKTDVPEKNIGSFYIGMPVKLSLIAFKDKEITALITKISAKGEIKGGAVKFPVEAVFTLNDGSMELRSGYSATGEVVLSSISDALTLPEKCINFKGDTSFVYLTDSLKEKAVVQIVKIGLSDGEKVQVVEGITSKDLIITNYYD